MFYKYIEHLSIFYLILYNSTLYFIKCFIKVWEYYLKFFKQSISSLLVLCRSLSRFQCCNPKMDHDQTNTRRAWMHSIYRTSHPASTLCSEPTPCRPCNRRLFQYCVCCFIVFIFYTAMSCRGVALLCRCALAPCATVCTHTWELYSDASCCSGHGTLRLGDECLTHLPRFCAGAKNEEFPLNLKHIPCEKSRDERTHGMW